MKLKQYRKTWFRRLRYGRPYYAAYAPAGLREVRRQSQFQISKGEASMRRVTLLAGLFSIALFWAGCSTPAPETNAIVYEGARLIVGDESAPIENSSFVVENDRFIAVGQKGQVTGPEGARRVDLTGKTVMPAIIDTHKHLPQDREGLIKSLEGFAYYGVGVATSLGRDFAPMFQLRGETIPNAARVRTAGRGITGPEPGRTEDPIWIKTEDEARKAVQENAANKVDVIKIWVDDRNRTVTKLSPALYGAVIDEAHKNNIRVTAHIFSLADAKGLLRANLDLFAHGVRDRDVDDEFLNLAKERQGLILAPNLPDRGVAEDMSWLADSKPAADLEKIQAEFKDDPDLQKAFGIQARNLKKMSDAGVKIAFGTDGADPWQAHVEMSDMVATGMTPAQVITAATRNSADLLQIADSGTVATGKTADFVVLDANPLDDIKNTRRISAVYLRGAEVDRAAVRAKLTAAAPPAAQ
ncbi:MAG: amidohydrolase family protein [Terriglobia bacterium]